MLRIDSARDPETLREMARLLVRENDRLHRRIEDLARELAALKGQDESALQGELEHLRELLALRERALFGASSEKRERPGAAPAAAAAPPRGHGPAQQPQLEVVEEQFKLDEADQACPRCGGQLREMHGQFEESEEITVVARHFRRRRILRQKYRCVQNDCIETALGPLKLQEGARYSPEFAVEVAIAKYLDHTPLERQVRIMAREGLAVTSQTLWDQIEVLARHLTPSQEAIRKHALTAAVVGADETRWPVLGHRREQKKTWQAWCVTTPDAVYFRICPSRSEECAREIFSGYQGTIVADGYAVYGALARGDPHLRVANCWAHVRRKFVEIESNFPEPCQQILALIGEIYAVEKSVRQAADGADQHLRLLGEARSTHSREIAARIQRWVLEQRALPQSGLGKAIAYMTDLWPGLTLFLNDPRIPLDNNATERAIRGPVVGRKNFYGARSRRGTEVAALFYSLIETAKQRSVEPKDYLLRAVAAALQNPGSATLPTPEPHQQ